MKRDRKFNVRNNNENVNVLQKELNKIGLQQLEHVYADVTHNEYLNNFINNNNLTQMKKGLCLCRLTQKRCSSHNGHACHSVGLNTDHGELFEKDGEPYVYVVHAYGYSMEDTRNLIDYCDERGLKFDIGIGSYHHPLGCVMVKIWNKD